MRKLSDMQQLESSIVWVIEGLEAIQVDVKAMHERVCDAIVRQQRARSRRRNADVHKHPHVPPSQAPATTRGRVRRIGPAPGYTPKRLPPVGEKWVHVGEGKFIPLWRYKKKQKKLRKAAQHDSWNS